MDSIEYREDSLSFLTIFRHWSVATKQEEDGLTLFLKLMKHYKPEIDYSVLPETGKQLLRIDGRDFPNCGKYSSFSNENDDGDEASSRMSDNHDDSDVSSSSCNSFQSERWNGVSSCEDDGWSDESSDHEEGEGAHPKHSDPVLPPSSHSDPSRVAKSYRRKRLNLPPAVVLPNGGGKLMYFGLECALSGDSPWTLFQHADIFQYIRIFYEDADVLPQCIRKKVNKNPKHVIFQWLSTIFQTDI